MSVDLPAPFSPISACTSPRRTSKETSSTARTPGKLLVTLRIANRVGGEDPGSSSTAMVAARVVMVTPLCRQRLIGNDLHLHLAVEHEAHGKDRAHRWI